jgi:HEAT repeat protein
MRCGPQCYQQTSFRRRKRIARRRTPMVALAIAARSGTVAGPSALPALESALAHAAAEVRLNAVGAISWIGTREAVRILVESSEDTMMARCRL